MREPNRCLAALLFALFITAIASAQEATFDVPDVVLDSVGFDISAGGFYEDADLELRINDDVVATTRGRRISAEGITVDERGTAAITVVSNGETVLEQSIPVIPGWGSLLAPLFAILLAFLTRSVIPSLFAGLWVGAWAVNGMTGSGAFTGFFETVAVLVVNAAIDPDRMAIMIFTLMIGGMVGVISRNGGMIGAVNTVIHHAHTSKRAQGIVACLGLGIFFDDYANMMIVGNATRPMTDKMRVSRDKLAYLVDSTAAPVSTVAVITIWIGFQLGLIDTAIADIPAITQSSYSLFLNSIPCSFYPFLAVFFVFLVALTGKDFGPLYWAERCARETGAVKRTDAIEVADKSVEEFAQKDGIPCRAVNAILPMITTVIAGLFISGEGETLTDIIGSADA